MTFYCEIFPQASAVIYFWIFFYHMHIFLNCIYFICFLAVLGLHRCTQAFSSCSERATLELWCSGSSPWWLLLWSMGSRHTGSVAAAPGLSYYGARRIFWTRDQSRVPCIGRQILNRWTIREVPWLHILSNIFGLLVYLVPRNQYTFHMYFIYGHDMWPSEHHSKLLIMKRISLSYFADI